MISGSSAPATSPALVAHKIDQFVDYFVEAVIIVVLIVALLFMEWRSAVLVALSIPITVAMTLGIFCAALGIDLQQISIAALIIALGLLVDDPVVAGDAINREIAHGVPRDVAAWLGPQKLSRAILYATVTNCVAFLPLLAGDGHRRRVHLLAAGGRDGLARRQPAGLDDVHSIAGVATCSRGQPGMEAGLAEEGRRLTIRPDLQRLLRVVHGAQVGVAGRLPGRARAERSASCR